MMKKILILFLLSALCFTACLSESIPNKQLSDTAKQADFLLGGVRAFLMGEKDVQSWIASSLKDAPAAEWYAIALSQTGAYDFSSCTDFLLSSFSNTSARAAVSRQKYALALLSVNGDLSSIQTEVDETIGAQGIMSYVYGLHLIHNGFESSLYTDNEIIETLLNLQLADGGWALSGSIGNADVTAMTVQALAPYRDLAPVAGALDRAVMHLKNLQEDEGGYKSYGVSNPESTAQVIVALTACGIDPFADERFVKNGKTLIDALSLFSLPDGSFSHTLGGASSPMATAQVFYSLVAYERFISGKSGLYEFDKTAHALTKNADAELPDASFPLYKTIALAAVLAISLVLASVLFLLKKRSFKNYLFILAAACGLAALILFSDFQSADQYYTSTSRNGTVVGSVSLEIRCDTIAGKTDKQHVPQDGTILKKTEFPLYEGDTVYDVLVEACRQNRIHMEKSGADGMIYICGIGYIYEFDFGDLSGWKYYVNKTSPSIGCDQYALKDGDYIEWLYSLELGNDIVQ